MSFQTEMTDVMTEVVIEAVTETVEEIETVAVEMTVREEAVATAFKTPASVA